jgi:hypothetical protein
MSSSLALPGQNRQVLTDSIAKAVILKPGSQSLRIREFPWIGEHTLGLPNFFDAEIANSQEV